MTCKPGKITVPYPSFKPSCTRNENFFNLKIDLKYRFEEYALAIDISLLIKTFHIFILRVC